MNAVLIICGECFHVRGCTEPQFKSCHTCVSHDCPILPARKQTAGLCETCAERVIEPLQPDVFSWGRAPGVRPSRARVG